MAGWSVTAGEMPLLGMHAAGPHGSPGAAAPGAFWELFRGEKFPTGGRQAGIARALSPNRPACGGVGLMKASAPTTESLPGTFDRGFSRKHFGKIPLLAY